MTRTRTGLLFLVVALAIVALVFTSGSPTRVGEPDRDGELLVELAIRDFEPDHLYLPTSEPLQLTLVNHSDVGHTLAFGRGTVEEADHPASPAVDMLADLEVVTEPSTALVHATDEHPWTAIRVETDETVTVAFTLPEDRIGEWELGCFSARGCYYEIGFRADVTVE